MESNYIRNTYTEEVAFIRCWVPDVLFCTFFNANVGEDTCLLREWPLRGALQMREWLIILRVG